MCPPIPPYAHRLLAPFPEEWKKEPAPIELVELHPPSQAAPVNSASMPPNQANTPAPSQTKTQDPASHLSPRCFNLRYWKV